MSRARLWAKMIGVGAVLCIGGPALVIYVTPEPDELFKKYNPELQKRSIANRDKNQREFDDFVGKLKGYSKSKKSIWDAAAEVEAQEKEQVRAQTVEDAKSRQALKDEIRKSH
ncbi:MAG: assembly factor cbp4 [Vezdaea aestivalis]|nr:MAG: assembly factor cbp4 [Vezdaea aestivalis]